MNYSTEDEDCGCQGYGHSCDYHREQSERRANEEKEYLKSKGVNPDAQVVGSRLRICIEVDMSDELSEKDKWAIKRILFPLGAPQTTEKQKSKWDKERQKDKELDEWLESGSGQPFIWSDEDE